eukprot:scaffold2183_cov185-Skeletonema_marinoi.AAC.2
MMMIMYTNPLQRQPQRLVYRYHHALKFRSSATPKRLCRGAYKSISCSKHSSLLTWPAIATTVNDQPRIHQLRYFHQTRLSSSDTAAISDIEHRVTELERTAQSCRLTNLDVQHELWPLLANCTSIPISSSSSSQYRSSSKIAQEQAIFKAKLSSRILELCLKEVEDRRVFLWDWLQTTKTSTNINDGDGNNNNNDIDSNSFSPTKFWNEAPHPTPQMFNLVLSSWKSVITESSSSDQHSIQLMEHAAKQASSLLLQMEEEYSSDTSFIQEYNARVDKGRYTTLLVGAAVPDVRNYSEVIGVWGQCIDGGIVKVLDKGRDQRDVGGRGRGNDNSSSDNSSHVRDGILQKRLRLEACAMKAMMELLESMEEDLYGTFSNSDTNDTTTATNMQEQQPRKKPPPDRVCYNIILASMARQLNPSLYEMRLVLQRMMERVQFELESESDGDDDDNYSYAMSFFPDIFSYNALIEARANRAAMFTSETSTNPHQFDMRQQQQDNRSQSRWRQQLTSKVPKPMKSRFTSSEEEAILAEQMLEEINHISTVSVRPNVWSYNAVIKAWIKSGTERGLHRSVLLLRSLALNGTNSEEIANVNNEGAKPESTTLFDRIAQWGTSLLTNNDSRHQTRETGTENVTRNNSKTNVRNGNAPQIGGVGIANRLNYLAQETPANKTIPSNDQISVGMHSRMLLMSSAFQSSDAQSSSSPNAEATDEKRGLDPIGPLPYIESDILPDITTFRLLINAMERRGSITSAKLAEDLLHLLEEYYFELAPTTAIYNSVLNAWSQAGKMGNDAKVSLYAAVRASALLDQMLDEERQLSGMLPPPNESSFLMVINAMSHAANSALKAGNISDAKNAAINAEELLQKMELQPLETRQIALSCRGSVVRIWASLSGMSGSHDYAARAHTLLMNMAEEAGHLPIDVIYFNVVLDAWARDLSRKDTGQAMSRLSKPRALLMDLIGGKYNAMPDNSSFNHVIRACYAPWASRQNVEEDEDRRNAWEMAFDVYSRMAERHQGACRPDAHTYTHMFKAIACLWPKNTAKSSDERVALCKNIFQSCCQDGQLSKTSFWVISTLLESSELMDLLSHELRDHNIMIKGGLNPDRLYTQMPAEWSRNGRNVKSLNRHKQ